MSWFWIDNYLRVETKLNCPHECLFTECSHSSSRLNGTGVKEWLRQEKTWFGFIHKSFSYCSQQILVWFNFYSLTRFYLYYLFYYLSYFVYLLNCYHKVHKFVYLHVVSLYHLYIHWVVINSLSENIVVHTCRIWNVILEFVNILVILRI